MQYLPEVTSLNRSSSHSRLKRDAKRARFVATVAAAALFAAGCDAAQLQIVPPTTQVLGDGSGVTPPAPIGADGMPATGETPAEEAVVDDPMVDSETMDTASPPATANPDPTESDDTVMLKTETPDTQAPVPTPTQPPTPEPTPPPTPAPSPSTTPPTLAAREVKELRYKPQIGTVVLVLDDPPAISLGLVETPGWDYFVSMDTPSEVRVKFAQKSTGQQGLFVATLNGGTVSATFKTDSTETVTLAPSSQVQVPKSAVRPVVTIASG